MRMIVLALLCAQLAACNGYHGPLHIRRGNSGPPPTCVGANCP